MNNFNFKKPKHSVQNKGFYIALGVCLLAVGLAAFFTYSDFGTTLLDSRDKNDSVIIDEKDVNIEPDNEVISSQPDDTSVNAQPTQIANAQPAESSSNNVSTPEESKSALFVYPVGKNVTKPFSGNSPVYSITLNDWRIHEGTDFSAEVGTTVKATSAGKVKDIYEDPSLGKTIVIEHDNGIESYYSGLDDKTLVQIGDNIDTNQDIGNIKSVPSEVLEESHLHFAMKKDNNFIDPMTMIKE